MDTLLTQVRGVLSTSPARWQSMAENVPVELLTRVPRPKEWSALECLRHVVEAEQLVLPVRVRAFLAGEDIPAFFPNAHGHTPGRKPVPVRLAAKFANLRKANLDLLDEITAADLSRTAQHSELGRVTLGEMMYEWAAHDLMHIVQAERAVMQYFIPGSGPWRSYFSDHDVEAHT